MKVQHNTQEVEVTGIATSQQMSMANNPILWSFLTDQLYTQSNAWIREYAQNARDVDKKWELRMPSITAPEVCFIDNGGGMSKEFMLNEFCQAGFSTKRTNNRQSGGFGIGRLSGPQGTIFECRNEDAIRTYTLTKSKDSIPTIHMLSEEPLPPDTKLGTTVRVPVPPTQVEAVKNDIRKFLKFFGLPGLPKVEYIIKRELWAIMKPNPNAGYNAQEATQVEVGGYTFPVTWSDLHTAASSAGMMGSDRAILEKVYARSNHGALIVHVPVGSVNVALNRESMKFDEMTVKTLLKVGTVVVNELADSVIEDFTKIKTRWEAVKKWRELQENGLHGMFDLIAKKIVWKGEKIDSNHIVIPEEMRCTQESYRGRRSKQPNNGLPMNVRPPVASEQNLSKHYIDPHGIGDNTGNYSKFAICIVDTDDAVSRRLRAKYTMEYNILYINPPPPTIRVPDPAKPGDKFAFLLEDNPALLTEWWKPVLDLLDMPPGLNVEVTKLSEITPLDKAVRAPRDPNAPKLNSIRNKFFIAKEGAYLQFEGVTDLDLDSDEVRVWIPIHAGEPDKGKRKEDDDTVWEKEPWELAAECDEKSRPKWAGNTVPEPYNWKRVFPKLQVIGVPRAFRKQVPAHWVHLLDYIREQVPDQKEWDKWMAVGSDDWALAPQDVTTVLTLGKKFKPTTPFGLFAKQVQDFQKTREKGQTFVQILSLFDVTAPKANATNAATLGLIDFKTEYRKLIDSSVPLSIIVGHGMSSFSSSQLDFLIEQA